jgi:glycosyltransferase involved in cell wall biosynthesis
MKSNVPAAVLRQNPDHLWHGVQCRLLYLVGQLGLGGLERQLHYLLAHLDHARYQPAVVVWNMNISDKYYREIETLNIPIHGFPPELSSLSKLRSFRDLARQVAPEVIHSYGFHTNFAAYYAALGTSALAIGSLRSDFAYAKAEGGIVRGALNARWPYYFIANSVTAAGAARQNVFAPRKVYVVRNGLDLNRFNSSDRPAAAKLYIAAVGSLFPVKRWDRLLNAVQRIKRIRKVEVNIRIAGEGPLHLALEKMVENFGISKAVNFVGPIHDMPSFLKQARFLVHSSESEGCPNAVMEAMACGLPVVAMEAGDISYLVDEGETGFLVPQDDEENFAERIYQLHSDDALCSRMGLAARAKAEKEFSLERLVAETLAAYKEAGWQIPEHES